MKSLEAEDIVQILNNDVFESHNLFNNDKGQWVQFLMQNINNDNVLMIGRVDKNKLQNFSVTVHKNGLVNMIYLSDDVLNDPEYKKEIFDWSNKFGGSSKIKNHKTWDGF
jgi:hypothetical protein